MRTLLLLVLAATAARAQAPRIGAAGAVSGRVTAAAGAAAPRALASGSDVFFKDAVTTDAKGRLQVMLLDQTVFTVGPDSRMVLDEFVYDPNTDAGKVAAQVTKGVFRFVTGKVAGKDPTNMKIKVPSGTIGIRGTFGAGQVAENGDTLLALLGPGPDNNGNERVGGIDVTTDKETQSLDEPGTGVIVKSDGDVSDPFTLSSDQLASLDSGGGDSDGGSSGGGSSGGSAAQDDDSSESTGQSTALASESSSGAGDIADESAGLNADSNTAAQDASFKAGLQDGVAKWDDVRTIQSGTAHYNGSGSWDLTVCNGGSCANNNAGSFSFNVDVDFGARTFGSGGSNFSGNDSDTSAANTGGVFASVNIPQTDFTALSGDATFTRTSGSSSASFKFINAGGTAATSVEASISYDDGSDRGSGSGTANRQDGYLPQ